MYVFMFLPLFYWFVLPFLLYLFVPSFILLSLPLPISYRLLSLLGSTAQLRPWPPPQNPAEFLGGFSTIFLFTV
jgi:hypothetical protein